MGHLALVLAGEPLVFTGARAAFWPARSTLLVADLHWGKTETFRAHGLPIPDGSLAADLARLHAVLTETCATRLVVLGDMIHHALGLTEALVDQVTAFRRGFPGEVVLLRGNHDRHAPTLPVPWGVRVVEGALVEPPFAFAHEAADARGGYAFAGHIHPVVTIRGGGDTLRLPCFHTGASGCVLPAFSEFTGGVSIRRRAGDRIFAVAEGHVVEVLRRVRRALCAAALDRRGCAARAHRPAQTFRRARRRLVAGLSIAARPQYRAAAPAFRRHAPDVRRRPR